MRREDKIKLASGLSPDASLDALKSKSLQIARLHDELKLLKEHQCTMRAELAKNAEEHKSFLKAQKDYVAAHPEIIKVISLIEDAKTQIRKFEQTIKICKASLTSHKREKAKEFKDKHRGRISIQTHHRRQSALRDKLRVINWKITDKQSLITLEVYKKNKK